MESGTLYLRDKFNYLEVKYVESFEYVSLVVEYLSFLNILNILVPLMEPKVIELFYEFKRWNNLHLSTNLLNNNLK